MLEDLFSDSDHQVENAHPNTLPDAEAIFEKNFNFSAKPRPSGKLKSDEKLATGTSAAENEEKLEKRNSSTAESTRFWTTFNYFNLFFVS